MSDDAALQERDQIADRPFRVLLDLYITSDSLPLSDQSRGVLFEFLGAEASKRGYDTVEEAFIDFGVEGDA
jgi:hypothetical protein